MSATMAILDGYTVEPSGLGVPPYLSTYVRDAYSALRKSYPSADVRYLTIDDVRWCLNGHAPSIPPPQSDPRTYSATVNVIQSAAIRWRVASLEEPIAAAVLDCEVAELVEVITGRVVTPDGTLISTGNRAVHRELSSGEQHRTAAGRLSRSWQAPMVGCHHIGEPLPGRTHDLAAVLEGHLQENPVITDLGYLGEPVVTPVKKPPKGELSPAQTYENSPPASLRSPHSNSTDSTEVPNNAQGAGRQKECLHVHNRLSSRSIRHSMPRTIFLQVPGYWGKSRLVNCCRKFTTPSR